MLEIQLWKIDDSLSAPKFNIVERPNDWAKIMKAAEGVSDTKKFQMEFWQAFNEYAFEKTEFKSLFFPRKALPQHWYNLSIGSSTLRISVTVNTQKKLIGAEIYVNDDKELFEKYRAQKEAIETELGRELQWRTATKDCRILALNSGDISKGKTLGTLNLIGSARWQ